MYATDNGHVSVVEMLLNAGANLDVHDEVGR